MPNQTPNNKDENNYEMPTTNIDDVGNENPMNNTSGLNELIQTTGNLNPTKFWMVFMIVLTVGLSGILFFGGGYLTDEIKSLKKDNKELQVKLDDCPDKTLEKFKKQQADFNDLKRQVMLDAIKLDSMENKKNKTLEKIEQIDKMK